MIKIRKTRSWRAIKAKYLAQGNNAVPPVGLCSNIFLTFCYQMLTKNPIKQMLTFDNRKCKHSRHGFNGRFHTMYLSYSYNLIATHKILRTPYLGAPLRGG